MSSVIAIEWTRDHLLRIIIGGRGGHQFEAVYDAKTPDEGCWRLYDWTCRRQVPRRRLVQVYPSLEALLRRWQSGQEDEPCRH